MPYNLGNIGGLFNHQQNINTEGELRPEFVEKMIKRPNS
jgi:hypothetical protein